MVRDSESLRVPSTITDCILGTRNTFTYEYVFEQHDIYSDCVENLVGGQAYNGITVQ